MKYSDLKMKYSNLRFAVSVVLALLLVTFGVYGTLDKDRKRDQRVEALELRATRPDETEKEASDPEPDQPSPTSSDG